MKKVLMITNSFPPPMDSGRSARLARRAVLSLKYGWETVVLTQGGRTRSYAYNIGDNEIKVHQVGDPLSGFVYTAEKKAKREEGRHQDHSTISKIWKISRPLFFPDQVNRWIIPMAVTGRKIIKEEKIEAIYTMNYPFSLHLVGIILKKCTNLPWLAEFRDPWVKNTNPIHFIKGRAGLLHKIFERRVVELSDMVAFHRNIQMEQDYFYKTYPDLPKDKFHMLPFMGYDTERFERTMAKSFDRFTITHAGSLYGGKVDLANFLRGLKIFIKRYKLSSDDLQVNFLGDWEEKYDCIVKGLHLDSMVKPYGWVPYDLCLSFLKGSDLLLLITRRFKGDELNIPSKIFEYIGAKKPILALARPHCRVANLIRSENLGLVVDPNDPKKIAEALRKIYSFNKSSLFSPSEEFLRSLDAENVEKQFCHLLDEIVSNPL